MRFAFLLAALASRALFACTGDGDNGDEYSVGVQFNETVQQEDIDEVEALLRDYDQDLDFVVLELFPPEGRATLVTNVSRFCPTVQAELESLAYVESVSCRPIVED